MTKKLTEAEQLAEDLKIAAYADYHIKRGTGTWRDWERNSDTRIIGGEYFYRTSEGYRSSKPGGSDPKE